jgi:hypothetical protein
MTFFKVLLILFIVEYFVVGICLFSIWLMFFLQDEDMSLKERYFSFILLGIGVILWPLIVPIAYLRLIYSKLKQTKINDLIIPD